MSKEFLINISLKYASYEDTKNILSLIDGIEEIIDSGEDGETTKVTLRCGSDNDIREEIYKNIKQQDWVIMEFHHEAQTLERVFRDITREN